MSRQMVVRLFRHLHQPLKLIGAQTIAQAVDGANNVASRTYNVGTSLWVVPAG